MILRINAILSEALGKEVKFVSQVPKQPQLEEYWPDIEALDNRDIVTDEDLPADTKILRTAAQHNQAHVGVYAEVLNGGSIRCDDLITIVDQ